MKIIMLVFLALFLLSCEQGEGERCQLDSDCDTGKCCKTSGASPATSGVCCRGEDAFQDAEEEDTVEVADRVDVEEEEAARDAPEEDGAADDGSDDSQ